MGYSRRKSNYLERITISHPTDMMRMADPVAIDLEIVTLDSGCFLEKEFTKLIRMNPWMILYQTINQVALCRGYVRGLLTWDIKDILWIDEYFFIITYKSLATRFQKFHVLERHEVLKDDCVVKMGSSSWWILCGLQANHTFIFRLY